MARQHWFVGGAVVVAAVVLTLARPAEPVAAAPPEERGFLEGAGLRVVRRGSAEPYFLTQAAGVRIGDRAFLYGRRVGAASAVYVPVSDVELIEEFADAEQMRKDFRLPEAK